MKLPLYFTIPLLVAANGFTLILTQKNGEKIEIPTEEIADMRFAEIAVPGNKIPTPQLVIQNLNNSDFLVQWHWVSNASSYEWSLDGGATKTTAANEFRVTDLKEGTHQVKVRALTTNPDYENSDYAEAELVATLRLQTTIENIGMNSVSAKIRSNSDKDYMVAIVPEGVGRNESDRIAYINANPTECQRKTVTGTAVATVDFEGLEAGTQYCVVGFRDDLSYSFGTFFSTSMDLKPGSKGSIFPNGVSENGGFVDVDKVGDPSSYGLDDSGDQAGKGGGDDEMCWACTASGLSQWWLDEYKRVTGEDYALKAELPSHGVYSTDIMEAIVLAYPNTAGDALMTMEWFFSGVERNSVLNGLKTYNESYPHWKGGFMGMSRDEFLQYVNVSEEASDGYLPGEWPYNYHCVYSTRGLSTEQAKKKFSRILIETLREGPVGVIIPNHSVAFWGCDYEVDQNGDPIVTALYVGENGNVPGNVKNGLNKGTVTYSSNQEIWFTLPSMHDSGSVKTTCIHSFFGIKGYKAK